MDNTFCPFSLDGKTVLVTGATSGIGKAIAVACSRMGASVIATGRNGERLKQTCGELYGNVGHQSFICDLTDEGQISSMVANLPVLDGLVHAAGMGHRKPCRMLGAEDVNMVMDTNFKSVVLLQAALLRNKKIAKGASVVLISSLGSESPSVGNALYSASKGALISYANCLSIEMAPRLIRVNCIQPAMVWTDLIYEGGITKEELEADEKKYPLKRYGTPEDVANLAIYLLSDASSWMTGSSIKLTGGGRLNQ